jgi:uncharacterized membrane protein YdbT with pleckstrin-like domain
MDLALGEHQLFSGHPSWRSTIGFYLKGLLVTAVAVLIAVIAADTGAAVIAGIVLFGVVLVVGFVRRLATTYTITNHRLHIRRGIIARRTQEARLERVQNVNTTQGVLERILQVGTVDFDTAGTTDSDFAFRGVSQPEKVVAAVDRAQREHQHEFDDERQSGL